MTTWDRDDPGAGDLDTLDEIVDRAARHLSSLPGTAGEITALVQDTRTRWTGAAAESWERSMLDRAAQVDAAADGLRRGAETVNAYAGAVRDLRVRARTAGEDFDQSRHDLARTNLTLTTLQRQPDPDPWELRLAVRAVQNADQLLLDHQAALDRLVTERQQLDDDLVAALSAEVPPVWSQAGGAGRAVSTDVLAQGPAGMARWVLDLPDGPTGDALARWLVSMLTPEEFDALLTACPQLAVRLMGDDAGAFGAQYPELAAALKVSDPQRRIDAVLAACQHLGADELALLARMYPGMVHNLDGVPLTTRIAANRVAITAALAEADAQITRTLAEIEREDDAGRLLALRVELAQLRRDRDWYDQLLTEQIKTIDADGAEVPRVGHQVVLFDPAAGRFGELVGYAGAPNVAVLVGGTGTNLGNMDGQFERAWEFVDEGSPDLAVITYLGGPMPQSVLVRDQSVPDQRSFEAFDSAYALSIAPHLASFANGVKAVTGATITVAGHSYGGSVVGRAEVAGMVVDRVLHIESAGAGPGVGTTQDYAAPDTPRYSMTAPGDPITLAQGTGIGTVLGHGLDPDELPGVTQLETGRVDRNDPYSGVLSGPASHSGVFESRSDAWANILAVMIGGEVTVWTDPTVFIGSGVTDEHYTYPMQDPGFVPPTEAVR
ncbi:alpha/beta hydrolase [Cellulomonas denverensis]|uniref:DUF1023 domain-containing protein n=1 Tax=Cellulomonas denverensis TaxID=264297 RepID=A0A7X6KRS6_9CELL|nr:alpha/beta hydrolase [Cellulomonas denverensis]NKY21072.1 hypothetical protein [Cellulomonas denverensis]GIG26019.1 hypothetical protein Cde04nite_22630 [Cellulomonas denverensis]